MAEHEDDSFKNMNFKEKTVFMIGISLLIIMVLGFVFGLYFFGFVGVFNLIGVEYQSIWSLVMFVVCFYILGLLFDLFFDAMAKIAVQNISGTVRAFRIKMFFGFVSNWLVLFVVDTIMESITLSLKTKLIVALLLGVLELIFDNKKEDNSKIR
jgi:hypothetical protein